jgi:hypothetical protein
MIADSEWKKPSHGVRVSLFREGRRKRNTIGRFVLYHQTLALALNT